MCILGVWASLTPVPAFHRQTHPTGTLQEFLSSQINIFIYLFIYVKDYKRSNLAIGFESVQILQCHSSQSLLHGIIE